MLKKAVNGTLHAQCVQSTDCAVRYADFQVLTHEKTDI